VNAAPFEILISPEWDTGRVGYWESGVRQGLGTLDETTCLNVVLVEQLMTVPVNSYTEIDSKINEGTKNRTVASTNMNATSR